MRIEPGAAGLENVRPFHLLKLKFNQMDRRPKNGRALGSELPAQKLLSRSWVDPDTLVAILPIGKKLFRFAVDKMNTDTNFVSPSTP